VGSKTRLTKESGRSAVERSTAAVEGRNAVVRTARPRSEPGSA